MTDSNFSLDSLPCIICDKSLKNIAIGYDTIQPNDGLVCSTSGNYGSTYFDPFDGEKIIFNICDECMIKKVNENKTKLLKFSYKG